METRAIAYFLNIPDGHNHPLPRPADPNTDRVFRTLVEEANNSGDCIINVGNGYYRPFPHDAVDEKEYKEYMAKELSRARKIQLKRLRMKMAYEKRRDIEIFTNHTREA